MRKQSLELRRFRRPSRAGRISTLSDSARSASRQSGLSNVTEPEDDGGGNSGSLSDLDEELEEASNSDLDTSSLDEDDDDDDNSLLSQTEDNYSRRRARDEKRLLLDLSKHQQLLVDSQKMNQSIKRCLGWTEALITEGQRALDYQVKVSDVEIGGRVLTPDEEEDGGGGGVPRKGLLSPGLDEVVPVIMREVEQEGRRRWRQGLEEMEMEVDRMLEQSTGLKEVVPF